MPIIKPYFTLPKNIPIIGGEWGPFLNTHISKSEQKQLFFLFVVSLVAIFAFGAWAYSSSKNAVKEKKENLDDSDYSVSDFLGFDKLVDLKALGVGMAAGIVFGLIDNGGLWFGMDALDPVFDSKIPWVYGFGGGRRAYSGYVSESECVYYGTQFKDGLLESSDKVTINGKEYFPLHICYNLDKMYTKVSENITKNPHLSSKEKDTKLYSLTTNESAYANPSSNLFLGENMTKNEFFTSLVNHKINENSYTQKIKKYSNFLSNTNLPLSEEEAQVKGTITQKERNEIIKLENVLNNIENNKTKTKNNKNSFGFSEDSLNRTKHINQLKKKIANKKRKVWPGKSEKLANAWIQGWRPGKLTQSGIGNTFSDFLGSFLATFTGVLIINMTQISGVSLLSEVFGIVIGCILGIFLPRLISVKT